MNNNNFTGYGRNTTGGEGGIIVRINTVEELISSLHNPSPLVVILEEDLVLSSPLRLVNIKNKTLSGKSLTNLDMTKENSGILLFKNSENIILQNITFNGPSAYDCDGNDLLTFDSVRNAIVDHCTFNDGVDDNFDIKHNSNFITISWCKFTHLLPPKAKGSGGCNDHRFCNLIGCFHEDKPDEGNYFITFAYCMWGTGNVNRMVRCRNSHIHLLNCLWDSDAAKTYIGPENSDVLAEGCYFSKLKMSSRIFDQNYGGSNGIRYNNCYSESDKLKNVKNREIIVPDYSYQVLDPQETKRILN